MARSCDHDEMDRRVESQDNQHVVLDTTDALGRRTLQGSQNMAQKVNVQLHHNPVTDVMFADVRALGEGEHVDVIEVGEMLGFPGQIQVRVDLDKEIFYGLTIQNYAGFRRKLLWRYRMWSMQHAIQLLVSTLLVGLGIDRDTHRRPILAR
jgi:hypothetical protein